MQIQTKRIVITGIGVQSPIGCTPEDLFSSLREGKDNFTPLPYEGTRVKVGGQLKNVDEMCKLRHIRGMRFATKKAKALTLMAMDAIQSSGADELTAKMDMLIGSCCPPGELLESERRCFKTGTLPFEYIIQSPDAMALHYAAKVCNIHGSCQHISAICSSGINAIIKLCTTIQAGYADIGIAGSLDLGTTEAVVKGFETLRIMSPTAEIRPFDEKRNGTILSDGGACFVIESLDHAIATGRQDKIVCEITGFASRMEAYDVVTQDKSGKYPLLVMDNAISMSGVDKGDIQAMYSHGTGTVSNDSIEAKCIAKCFEDSCAPYVTATKSCLGHTLGGSASLSIAAAIIGTQENVVPGIKNFIKQPENDVAINIATESITVPEINNTLINAYGFGGYCSSIIISRYDEENKIESNTFGTHSRP